MWRTSCCDFYDDCLNLERAHFIDMHCYCQKCPNILVRMERLEQIREQKEQKRREEKRREEKRREEKRREQNRTEQKRREENRTEQKRREQNRTERTKEKDCFMLKLEFHFDLLFVRRR